LDVNSSIDAKLSSFVSMSENGLDAVTAGVGDVRTFFLFLFLFFAGVGVDVGGLDVGVLVLGDAGGLDVGAGVGPRDTSLVVSFFLV
jgi:hypothetical protein